MMEIGVGDMGMPGYGTPDTGGTCAYPPVGYCAYGPAPGAGGGGSGGPASGWYGGGAAGIAPCPDTGCTS
ncbi:hypothetical protein GCM10020218_059950 [Dactylosporangium vinaceum]